MIELEEEYQKKLVQGKNICEMLGEGVVSYQALPREMKDEVDLYMKNQEDFRDVGNVELKPWQEFIQQPSDREIVWVMGKEGNEGKNWFRNM